MKTYIERFKKVNSMLLNSFSYETSRRIIFKLQMNVIHISKFMNKKYFRK